MALAAVHSSGIWTKSNTPRELTAVGVPTGCLRDQNTPPKRSGLRGFLVGVWAALCRSTVTSITSRWKETWQLDGHVRRWGVQRCGLSFLISFSFCFIRIYVLYNLLRNIPFLVGVNFPEEQKCFNSTALHAWLYFFKIWKGCCEPGAKGTSGENWQDWKTLKPSTGANRSHIIDNFILLKPTATKSAPKNESNRQT